MGFKQVLNNTIRIIYGVIGATSLASLIWAIIKISHKEFYSSMGFFGSAGFFILTIGGLILLGKAIVNRK